ncbi:alpha/beta hydrolase [Thauera phenolivorans]|uniref:alpha/beta hydrolase n=1 Tax=Thauera phenolivorans TaxID=1792543 RepID=UPI00083B9788|nr:carboxylesterase [Thauera phenolivorans]
MPEINFLEIETAPRPSVAVIWMHGLGADGTDFEPVVPELGLASAPAVRFVFPHAPYQPVTCNGGYVMRAWYDIVSLEPDSREIDETGLLASRALIRGLIAREVGRGIPSHRIFLAGFSQGGAVAYLTALTHPEPLAGVIGLSTYIPAPELITRELAEANRGIPIFAAHGSEDDVVAPGLGLQALELLRSLDLAPDWHVYPMPHAVCPQEIADIAAWFKGRLDALPA